MQLLRPLSYLSDASLSDLLTLALRIAKRGGSGFVKDGFSWRWGGPAVSRSVFAVLGEYTARHGKGR